MIFISNYIDKKDDLIIKPDRTYFVSSVDTIALINKLRTEKIPFLICRYHSLALSDCLQRNFVSPIASYYDGEFYIKSSVFETADAYIAKESNINCLPCSKLIEKIHSYDLSLVTIIYTDKTEEDLFYSYYDLRLKLAGRGEKKLRYGGKYVSFLQF